MMTVTTLEDFPPIPYTSEDFGPIKDRSEWMPVYVYRYTWNRDYTALERTCTFSVGYDLKTGETIPF
jgi:hypothetical protein